MPWTWVAELYSNNTVYILNVSKGTVPWVVIREEQYEDLVWGQHYNTKDERETLEL